VRTYVRAWWSGFPRSWAYSSIGPNRQRLFFHSRTFSPLATATTFNASSMRRPPACSASQPAPISRRTRPNLAPCRSRRHCRDPSTSLGMAMACKAPPPPQHHLEVTGHHCFRRPLKHEFVGYRSPPPGRPWSPATSCFKFVKHFTLMFQVFHLDVAKSRYGMFHMLQ
jgi:hypothetical protein